MPGINFKKNASTTIPSLQMKKLSFGEVMAEPYLHPYTQVQYLTPSLLHFSLDPSALVRFRACGGCWSSVS